MLLMAFIPLPKLPQILPLLPISLKSRPATILITLRPHPVPLPPLPLPPPPALPLTLPPPPRPPPSPAPSPLPSSSPNSSPDPTPSASGGPSTTTKQIVITDPRNNSRIKVGTTMTISASVSGSSANKVEFKIDGTLVCTDTETPYSCAWQIPEKVNTKYSITAIAAYPDGGNAEDSIRITGSR